MTGQLWPLFRCGLIDDSSGYVGQSRSAMHWRNVTWLVMWALTLHDKPIAHQHECLPSHMTLWAGSDPSIDVERKPCASCDTHAVLHGLEYAMMYEWACVTRYTSHDTPLVCYICWILCALRSRLVSTARITWPAQHWVNQQGGLTQCVPPGICAAAKKGGVCAARPENLRNCTTNKNNIWDTNWIDYIIKQARKTEQCP